MLRRRPHLALLDAARAYTERSKVTPLVAACSYADQGVPVFPCHHPVGRLAGLGAGTPCSCDQLSCLHPAAHALLPSGAEAATVERAMVAAWWRRFPQANIGIVTGIRFDVLDVDKLVGALAVGRLQQAGVAIGPVARTPAGRWHFYCQPSGMGTAVIPGAFGSAPGTRHRVWWHGHGGYVLAPPSRSGTGAARWLRDLSTPLPEAPSLLRVLLAAPVPVA